MNYWIFLLALVCAGRVPFEEDERKLVRVIHNGANEGQYFWLQKSRHFVDVRQFLRRMQSYSENGITNNGYNRRFMAEGAVYREDGQEVQKWEDIRDGDSLFVVPFDELFMWSGMKIGRKLTVFNSSSFASTICATSGPIPASSPASPSLTCAENAPEARNAIELETLSVEPRIFRVRNLLTPEECQILIDRNEPTMTRSAVGKVDNYDQKESPKTNRRTSSNSFDDQSPVARRVIDRIYALLKLAPRKGLDGLQIVRYQEHQAYDTHTDFFPMGFQPEVGHNFDPMFEGSNRYVTVFAYLTDDFVGGQTVFPHVPIPGNTDKYVPTWPSDRDQTFELENSTESWEDKMTNGMCSKSLAVAPKRGDAVLFYSMKPNGRLDPLTEHGGCPVSNGTKYGANLWVWSKNKPLTKTRYEVSFYNEFPTTVQLFYFNPQLDPVLSHIADIQSLTARAFSCNAGDTFVVHNGESWADKFVIKDTSTLSQIFTIRPNLDLLSSFEYHIGYGAASRQQEGQPQQQEQEQQQKQQQEQQKLKTEV